MLLATTLVSVGCGAQQRLEQQVADQRARLQTLTNTYEAQNQRVEALRERQQGTLASFGHDIAQRVVAIGRHNI